MHGTADDPAGTPGHPRGARSRALGPSGGRGVLAGWILLVLLAASGAVLVWAGGLGQPRWFLEVRRVGPAGAAGAEVQGEPGSGPVSRSAAGAVTRSTTRPATPPASDLVARWPVRPGQEVVMEYLHSMFRVPVRERFRVTPGGLVLTAVEAPTPEIAWYYGDGLGAGWRLEALHSAPPLACGGFRWPGRPSGEPSAGDFPGAPAEAAGWAEAATWYRLAPAQGDEPAAAVRGATAGGTTAWLPATGAPAGPLRVRATETGHRSLVVEGRCIELRRLVGDGGTALVTVVRETVW